MKVKETLQQFFYEKEMRQVDNKHVLHLQKQILRNAGAIKKGRNKVQLTNIHLPFLTMLNLMKGSIFSAVSIAVILLAVIFFFSSSGTHPKGNTVFVQQVSAERLLNAMQVSINSERLHIVMETFSNAPDTSDEADSLGNHSISEMWIDRKAHITRLDRRDSKGRLRVMVIKQGLPSENDRTYEFAIGGATHGFNPSARKGFFISRVDHDGYDSYLDLTVRSNYIQTLKDTGVQVNPAYEEIIYKGHPAYKLTLKFAKDKMGGIRTEILTIDKQTQLPYENIDIYTGVPNTAFPITTTYSFSTDFSNDVFERKAPQGYTLIPAPKLENFDLYVFGDNIAQSSPKELWKRERQLSTLSVGIGEGMMPDGYTYKVFMSKESYPSEAAAQHAENVQFIEIKSQASKQKPVNGSSLVYVLPDIPNNDFTQYGMFKLEVESENGEKLYDVKQIMQYAKLIPGMVRTHCDLNENGKMLCVDIPK